MPPPLTAETRRKVRRSTSVAFMEPPPVRDTMQVEGDTCIASIVNLTCEFRNSSRLWRGLPGRWSGGQINDIWSRRLRHAADLPGRRSHEFGADRIADTFAKDGVDCGKVPFRQRPAANFVDGRKLFRMTGAPERDAN